MANHSSAKKAIRQIAKRTAVNKHRSSMIKTLFKRAIEFITGSGKEAAEIAFKEAQSEISRGVTKGILKKNTASRKISQLAAKLKNKQ